MDDNIKKLHQALIDDGYDDVGTEQEFRDYVSDSKNVATLYNALSEAGYDNFKDQKSLETYLSSKAPVAQKPSTPQSSGQSVSSQKKEQVEYPQEVLDAFNSPNNKPGNFKDLAQLNDEYQRGVLKKPGIISQALGMMPKVDAGNIGKEQKMGGMIANMLFGDNMQQTEQTQQTQDNNQQVQHPNQENAPATEQPKPTVKDVDATTGAAPVQQVDAIYNKYVGKGDALSETMYDLMASGQAQNQEEAQNMAMGAMNRAANRLAQRTTDEFVSKLGDTVEGVDEAVMNGWHSHAVQDNLKKMASQLGIMNSVVLDENGQYITHVNSYDQFINGMVKPAMVESLVKKYGENYRKIAEDLATRLYSNDEVIQNQLMNQDIDEALSSVISKYVNPSVVDEYNKAQEEGSKAFNEGMEGSQFIPANLRLGTALGAQYEANEAKDPAKVLSGLQKKFGNLYRNPEFLNDMSNAAFKVMQRYGLNGGMTGDPKQFKPMINSVLKNELDQLEIKGMMPKGSAEYIMKTGLGNTIVGKITRKAVQTDYQNWLEDIANQQYQPGFWENVVSGALTFAGDAWSYWLPGAAGGKLTKSMLAKAEGRLAGDLMAKGMESRMATRAAKLLIGKSKTEALKSGAVHGAVTFGGQSAISKPIDEKYRTGQFDENGKIYNPSGWKIALDTLLEGGKQGALGVIMQGNTIANMIGKGRGLATNILADIGGKVADSGIMTGHQMLERMAQDPNFKPTGKDAAESFLESMANLTAIGLPGMVGKYARFKDAREFNKKFDFTDQDIAELKRFGYDGLRDAFEKVGIGEYAVVGENAQRLDGQLTQKYMDLMNDKSVPEVLKAKMMAVVEGKRPSSFSPVVDSIILKPMDNGGKVYLETLNKDGGVVDRKEYSSLDEAQKADKKLEYEKTLGLASVLEGEFHNEFTQEHLEGLYNKAAQKYNMGEKLTDEDKAAVYLHQNAGAIKEIMDKQQKGVILTDEEQKQINAYRHYYDNALENSSVMREFVNTFEDSHGVARGTLRKALESKDKKYAPLVESYLKELYNSIELKREMKQTMDDLYNTSHGNEQKRIEGENPVSPVEGSAGGQEPPVSEGPAPYQDRTNSVPTPSDAEVAANPANSAADGAGNEPKVASSDAFVMGQNAYKNGDSDALQAIDYNSDLATGRLMRAFADNEKIPDIVANAYNEGRDMEQFVAQRASSLTPAQKEAISKYVEAMDAKKGAIDALQHADDGYGEALKEQLWPYQTEDGNIVPATLDSGKQVFLKKDNEYGGAFVVVPDEQGQPMIKQVSKASIIEKGTPVPLDQYIEKAVAQQKDARNKQFISQFDGSGLKRGDIVSVSMEEGDEPSDVKIVGYTDDGHVILTDTDIDVNAQIDPKKLESVTKEKFNAWRQNALNVSIGAELDAEDAQRANDDAAKAEAEKKQRYNDGIVGLSEGHPDYSSKDTDTKVAADYLQEQYGEDHGKLLNLVNGSRDDIKTQLANKRKAAAEYQNWLDTNADLDMEKAKKVEDELSLVNEQIADLDARFKNWNTIRNSVMTPDEVKAMTEERKAEVEKAGVDETAIVPSDDFHVLVLDDKELKKQYPTMDEATDYITSQRKDIYHTQEDVERKINGVNDMLDQYINGETELEPNQLMELNTTKAQLEALQTNLSVAAKGLKAQANKLSKLYKTEISQQEMEELGMMTPSEHRKVLVSDAIKKNDLGAIIKIYKDASVDVTDFTPQTLEEAVSEFLSPHSLNPESLQYELGKSNFKFGIGKGYDSNKFNYLIAKKGTGMSVNEFAVKVYNDLPVNLQDMGYTDQDVRNTLLDMFKSYDSVKEMKNVALMNRIAAAEDELASEEEYYEAQKEREIIERQAEIEKYKSYIHEKELSLPSESELDHINGLEFDRMMEIEDREREYKQYVKSILPELADYDDRSNEEGYGGGSSLGSDSSRRGVDEGNSQGEEVGNGEASSESEIGEGSDSGRKGRQETGSMEPGEGSAVRGSHLPQEASFGERLKSAIAETETEPTEAQKKAGNYKKGHLSFGGYDYTVETPKGVTRSGKDEQGKPWSVTMHDTYGYILGKIGVDGDHIDMFINDSADLDTFDGNVYVVDQVNPETGEFDEHKVMYGYPSEEAATEAYLANYSKGWKGLGNVTSVPKATFDKWLESSDRKTKPFADYAMVQKEQRAAYEEEMMQDGAHSEAFDKIVDLAKEQKEYWDLMEQGEVDPNEVPEVDVAHEMDKLLETLSDEEFKEVSDVLLNMDEEFEYWTANEHERREDLAERKNAAAYSEFLKQETKSIAPFADALRNAVNGGDKKAIAKAQKELTDALLASNLGHGYLSGQLEYAKSAKKKDESYSERRAFIKPLTDAINAIESALDSTLADVGLEGVHVDFKEYGYGWIYADKGSDWRDRLEPLDNDYRNVSQYSDVNPISVLPQITMNNVKKVAGIIKSRIEEGERYNSDENQDENIEEAKKAKDNLPFHRDVKEVEPSEMTEAQKVAYDAVSTMLKKAGIPVKVVSNEDMEKVAEAQDNLNLAMLLNQPEMRFKIKTPEEKLAAENAYNFAKELRPDKWKQYAVVDMSNPIKMPEYFEKQELARKERSYYNKLMWGNYKVFNLDKSFEDNVAGLTGSFPSEFDPYKIDELTNKRNELKKQMKETEEAYKLTGQERVEYQNQLMKEYMHEHGLASENDIPDDVWNDYRNKSFEKYQDKLDSLFAKYKDLDRQLKAIVQPGVRFLRTYHGTGASFDKFDLSHALQGEGSETFGHGVYVTNSRKIGEDYASRAKSRKANNAIFYPNMGSPIADNWYAYFLKTANSESLEDAKEFVLKELDVDIKSDENKLNQSSISEEKRAHITENLKEEKRIREIIANTKKEDLPNIASSTLYDVDIPDDNGENYLGWNDSQNFPLEKWYRLWEITHHGFNENEYFKDGGANYDKDRIERIIQMKLDSPENGMQKLPTLKGEELYHALEDFFDRERPSYGAELASRALGEIGFVGIKYPAGMIHGGAKEGDYNYVIFDENNANIVGNTKFAQGKGVVYGYTDGKEIVLNQEHLNPNTPIHEYQHLWRTAAKEMNPGLIAHGDELIKQTQLFADLKEDPNYKHLSDDEICDEAFARLTGEDGAAILEQMAKDAIKENPLDTAKELTIINRLKNWLKKFWYWTLDTFTKWKPEDIKKMTLEDIRNLVLRDLAQGVDPRTVMNEKKEGVKLSNKEKDDATERIDKRIAELNRQEKEQSFKSENGNLAESHDNGYLPSKNNLDGVQSVAPSSAKIDKKFPTKTFYLGNLANFITSMGKNADITAGNFTKKLFEGMGMTPHGKDTQVSEYFKYQTDDGGKTTVRLSDHSGNALSIIKKGGRADKGYSIVVRVDSSPKTKFKANKYSNVAEYVYENPNADGLKDIARSVFNLIDTGEYLDLAGANEVHVSPRNNDADKTLAGVHNITEEKLRKALKLGGLANPSLAVIDTSKSAHDNFGEISFIAPSALVDKRTGKTGGTWITDAYTQRYPSVERQMSEKGSQKFEDWVDSLEYPSAAKAEIKRQTKDVLEDNGVPAWELMYLKEKGIDIKAYDSNVDYRWKEIINKYPTVDDILNSMQNDPELNEDVTSLAKYQIVKPTRDKISLEVRRQIYKETGVKTAPISPKVRKKVNEIFERDYASTLLDKDGKPKADDVKKVVEQMVKEHNDTKKYDFYLSKVKASNYVHKNGLYADYIRWQENKLDEFGTKNRIFRGYKNDGSRKYVPETLENVSKAMREEADGQTNGGEYTSFGSFIAKLASRVDSTSEMRANKDKLSSNEDKEAFYEKWEDVYYELAKFLYNDVFYGEQRLHDIVLQPDPKKYAKKEYGITLTPSFMKKLDSLKNAVQNDLKSAYFETKFNRPVHLNEFVAAVVPNDLGEDVRKGLEESGLSLFDYDPEKEGDRSRAFNEAINSNNQIRFHRVTEPEELERLNKEKTFRMYSGMQELDGKLYSPMAAIIDGKRTDATEIGAWMRADERPDLVKNGKFQLVKTDKKPGAGEGPVPAAYNPYMHTSTSVMNDQFSGAYARGNIKVVEWEIPESEKTSGYHAEGAKDSVGLVPWTSGTVNSLLPKDRQRSVMLSRWRKAVRIVPDEEVAEKIADQLNGTGLAIPWNVVTPNQLRELAKLGVPITTVEQGIQNPEVKEQFLAQMDELKKEFPQAQFVDVKMTKEAFKEWGSKGIVKSPIVEQKLKKHPDSLMKAGTYFSGGGLVEEGLKGIIDPVVAVEYDRKISGVYRNNFGQHIVTADVRDVDPKELVKHIDGDVEYFHASPVCKNYSQAKSNGGEVELDKETAKSTADFIDAVKPRVVTIENVKGYKDSEAMKIITQALDKNGYTWDADVYNAADFGGYTNRERLIVRAVKDGELPEKPKKQPRKGGWLEAVEDILPTLTVKESGVAPWMDARLKADGIDWQKVEKPLYVMGSAYADGKIPHAYGDEILPTLRTKSGDVIIMPGGKVLRADGRVLARITGLGDDYLLPKTESLAHTIIGNGIPVQLTQGVIAPLLNKDDLSGRNVLARLGKSIFKNDWDADKQKKVSDQVVNTANKLGGAEATVYTSVDEVPDAYLSEVKNGATGWYDPETHTVHVYLPNCADANEAQRTVFHEKIGHEGMEVLLGGEDEVRKFANFVYNSVAASTRGKILEIANEYDPDWKKHDRMNVGTQEYIARLAEEGPKTAEDFTLWTKIKHYLIKVLKKLGVRVPGLLNDKDLRYYLMKAGKALHVWDNMPKEKQEAMMKQASNAEIKDSLGEGVKNGKPRQKKGESTIQYMKRVQEWRKWKNAREDENDPEPPMFYDIDKDEAGKKEWAQLNKDWRERHHLAGEEPMGMPIRMEGEEDGAYMTRIHEYEKWKEAMKDQEDPMPDMFAFEKKKQEEVKRKYEDWLARHELLEQQQADLDLYEGKIYPAETNPKADDLEQQVMQDLAEVTSTDVSKEGAAKTVKHAVIHRRKNMEEASADDAIYINDVKNRIEKMADSGAFDKLLSDYQGKPNRAEKLAEAIPYIIEAPRRLRDLAHDLNATGAFDKGHIHIQPADVEAIQPYVADLIAETGKKHTELKDGKEVEVYDDPQAVSEVASKMAQVINANHQGEEGFVPIDGTDILSEHVLPLVKQQIVPKGIDYKNLSPEMKSTIDSIRDWYNYTYDWLKDNHTLREDTGYNADYVNHIWDKEKSDKQAYALYVENRQRTKSPNEKKRTISTLMEGISVGLVPKTTDITKMMAYYSRSNIEAWVNKTMLQELSGLNVIERNEEGEVVSTDPLLSSSAPFNLEQYQYFEIPGVGPVWVYNVSPKQVKVKNPITGKEKVLYSEASAGDRFGVVFETYQSSPFWKAFDTLASSAKKLELGFSGFHAGALTEVYMVQNMVEFGPKKAMANFMKYIFADTAKNHELPCFANPQDFQEAASHLVKFGATNDYAAADVQNMFDNMRDAMIKVQKKLKDGNKISGTVALASMPLKVATQMLSLINKGMDRALWDFLHDGLKLATYRMRADKTKERAKKKGWSAEELSRALDEDGQFVNDMFGGQLWVVLGASHRTLRYAGRVLLSPDWNASTTRHFLALTGFGSIWNEATFENFKQYYQRLWHKELMPEDEGRRSRQISSLLCYGIGFMVFYEAFANGVNAAFRAQDEEKERKKAEEIRKTNPSYKSMYELAYGDEGMKWYDYLMRGNSLGQQSKIFLGRYADGTEMYIRHGKQFREVPEYLFNHKGELEFPGPMVQRMIGKANPMVRMTLDDINYLSDFQASHADQEIQRKYGKTIGLLYKDALYWAPFLIPSQENKEFKAVDFFFPSSKGFSPWKAQSYFKDFILSGDMEGVVMTYQSCQRNGIDAEAQIKAAIGSVKALESAEMSDGVTSLQEASKRFDAAKSITEKKKMRQKMKKFLSQSDYKAFTQKEALDMVQGYLNGDEDLKEMEKAESKYLMKAKAEDVTEDWRIQNVWNGTMETYQEYQRLKDIDKAKANAFKNSKTNKRLFAARKAISAAKKKMNKAKKQMDGQNDAAKLVEIRNTRKELLKKLNGME